MEDTVVFTLCVLNVILILFTLTFLLLVQLKSHIDQLHMSLCLSISISLLYVSVPGKWTQTLPQGQSWLLVIQWWRYLPPYPPTNRMALSYARGRDQVQNRSDLVQKPVSCFSFSEGQSKKPSCKNNTTVGSCVVQSRTCLLAVGLPEEKWTGEECCWNCVLLCVSHYDLWALHHSD